MMTRIYNLVTTIALATMLAIGGFGAFLVASGKLNATRMERIAQVLRGELDEPAPEDPNTKTAPSSNADANVEADPVENAMDAPVADLVPAGAPSAEEVRMIRRRDHLQSLVLERTRRDIEAQRRLLEQALHTVVTEQETLEEQRETFSENREKLMAEDQDRGFEQELEYIAGLAPKQAKEHLVFVYKKSPADAVRLLMHLDVGRGKRIMAQFKTPEELQIMSQLLEQLRVQSEQGSVNASGKTTDGTQP